MSQELQDISSECRANPNIDLAHEYEVLDWWTAIRRQPDMYLGDTATAGLHRLVVCPAIRLLEPVDGQTAELIRFSLHGDGSVTVAESNGGRTLNEVELTTLSKQDLQEHRPVGLAVVNALSEWFQLGQQTNGRPAHRCFHKGQPRRGRPKRMQSLGHKSVTLFFKPDPEIFGDLSISFDIVSEALEATVLAPSSPSFILLDERSGRRRELNSREAEPKDS